MQVKLQSIPECTRCFHELMNAESAINSFHDQVGYYVRTHYNKVYKSVQNTFREIFMARTIHQTNRTSFSRILRSFAVCTG